jgi:hypothetical protein
MKGILLLVMISCVFAARVRAQEVADVDINSRFKKDQGVYAGLNFAGVLGKTLGDYGGGFGLEVGYMRRLNKLVSLGAGISTLSFRYDAAKTYKYYYDIPDDQEIQLSLHGGNVNLISLGINAKINFIPVSDASKFSVYGIVSPYISVYTRGALSGQGDYYNNNGNAIYNIYSSTSTWDGSNFPALKKASGVTGGANLGFGVEWLPARTISYFLQATVGLTGPISYVSSESYLHNEDKYSDGSTPPLTLYGDSESLKKSYFNDNFPIVKKSFTTATIRFGVAFNF